MKVIDRINAQFGQQKIRWLRKTRKNLENETREIIPRYTTDLKDIITINLKRI